MSCSTIRSAAAEVERAITLIKKLLDIQNTQNKAENFILRVAKKSLHFIFLIQYVKKVF
jgi:hypothetical protein